MKEKILSFLDDERYEDLQALIDNATKEELAKVLETLDEDHLAKLFDCLDKELAADVFVLLKQETQKMLLEHFSDIEMQEVTEEILDEKPEELLESMPLDVVQEVLLKADPEQRNDKIVEILNFLEYKKFVQLKPLLSELKPMDIAEIFAEIDEEKLPLIFRLLPKELAAETFVEMNSTQQELLIRSFSDHELKLILEDLFVDDTVDLIEEMPANVVKRILMQADSETRKSINEILKYPKDSAGSIMTTECISLRQDMTVQQCFEKIRAQAIDKETIYTCYVTDNQKKLLGIVTVKDLLLHSYNERVEDFMQDNFVYADTLTDKEDVANTLSKYDLLSIPVVDQENLLVGIVTVDDALDVITEEATEDISFINAVTPSDKPYLETGVFRIYLHRIPWLLILMISATFTGLILNTYETMLSTLLVACVPMVMGTGRQCGQPGVRHGHPRHGARRNTAARYIERHLERDTRIAPRFRFRRLCVLCQIAAHRPTHFRLSLFPALFLSRGRGDHVRRHRGEDRGLLHSHLRENIEDRPRGVRKPLHHDHYGRFVPAHFLRRDAGSVRARHRINEFKKSLGKRGSFFILNSCIRAGTGFPARHDPSACMSENPYVRKSRSPADFARLPPIHGPNKTRSRTAATLFRSPFPCFLPKRTAFRVSCRRCP